MAGDIPYDMVVTLEDSGGAIEPEDIIYYGNPDTAPNFDGLSAPEILKKLLDEGWVPAGDGMVWLFSNEEAINPGDLIAATVERRYIRPRQVQS